MSRVTTSYRFWVRGSHRNHHSGGAGAEVPGLSPSITDGTTWEQVEAPTPPQTEFLFWSVTGSTDNEMYYPSQSTSAHFSAGSQPASMTAWYLQATDGPPPPPPPAVYFDAFSLAAGDFLDWGDTFDPFTVNPAAERSDDAIETSGGSASLTAAEEWPDTSTPLLFTGWLTFGFSPTSAVGRDLLTAADQSGVAFALYATPAQFHPTRIYRIPPYIVFQGDPSDFSQDIAQLTTIVETAGLLSESTAGIPVQQAALEAMSNRVQEQLKQLS